MIEYRERDFLEMMTYWFSDLELYGNEVPEKAPSVWQDIGKVLAAATRYDTGAHIAPIRAVPVSTGVGKSLALRLFALLHADQTNWLLAAREIADCETLRRDLDDMAVVLLRKKLIARIPSVGIWATGHRDPNSFGCDILCVTHEACRRAGGSTRMFNDFNEGRPEYPTPEKPEFSRVQPGLLARRWVADESYKLSDDSAFDLGRMVSLSSVLGQILSKSDWLAECAGEVQTSPETLHAAVVTLQAAVAEIVAWGTDPTSPKFKGSFTTDTAGIGLIARLLEAADAPKLLRQIDGGGLKSDQAMVEAFECVKANWGIRYGSGEQVSVLNTVTLLPLRAPSLTILDATARHSAALLGLPASIPVDFCEDLCTPSRQPRLYDRVCVHPLLLDEGSHKAVEKRLTGEIVKEAVAQARKGLPKEIRNGQPEDARVLLMTWKSVKPAVERMLRESKITGVTVGHWGKDDRGTNSHKGCSAIVLLGAFRQPDALYQSMLLAHAGPCPTEEDYTKAAGQARSFQSADMTAAAIQAINRISVRTVVDTDGRCNPANVVVAVTARTWDVLRDPIQEAMPGIQLMPSTEMDLMSLAPREGRTRQNSDVATSTDRLIRYVQGQPQGSLCGTAFNDLLAKVGVTSHYAKSLLRREATDATAHLGRSLRDLGYTTVGSGRGRSTMKLQRA